jgi:hypothetical protein
MELMDERTYKMENEEEQRHVDEFIKEYKDLCEKHNMRHKILFHNSNLEHDPFPYMGIVYKCKSYQSK